MDPATIVAAISAAEKLIEFLLAAKAAGQLTDAQLDQLTANRNSETRALILKALGTTPPGAIDAPPVT